MLWRIIGERKQRSENFGEVSELSLGSIRFNHIRAAYRFHEAALLPFLLILAHSPFDFLPFKQWLLFSHIMSFLGKVIPVRLLKRSNGDRTPKHSIATGLSTVLSILPASMSPAPVTMNKQPDVPGHLPTSTFQDKSVMDRATNVIREGLNVLSPIAEVIPMAGTPLKASIDALLVVLNSINVSQRIPGYLPRVIDHHVWQTRDQNKENAAHLTRRLYRLKAAISAVPPASAKAQMDELARYVSLSEF